MIDATQIKAHRTAASLQKKGSIPSVSDSQRADWTQNSMLSATVRCFFAAHRGASERL